MQIWKRFQGSMRIEVVHEMEADIAWKQQQLRPQPAGVRDRRRRHGAGVIVRACHVDVLDNDSVHVDRSGDYQRHHVQQQHRRRLSHCRGADEHEKQGLRRLRTQARFNLAAVREVLLRAILQEHTAVRVAPLRHEERRRPKNAAGDPERHQQQTREPAQISSPQ
jgi:hypothetical protein